MNENQAKAKLAELDKKSIQRSAVLNGEKSAVTVAKKDTKTAYFSRSLMRKEAQRVKQQGRQSSEKSQQSIKKNNHGLA